MSIFHEGVMYIKVRVCAGVRRESLEEVSPTSFKISVREQAEGNKANARVREIIARHFNIPLKTVRIVNGHHSPSKLLLIGGVQ